MQNGQTDGSQDDSVSLDRMVKVLLEQANSLVSDTVVLKENNRAAERVFDPNEGFANWLNMTLGDKTLLDLDEYQLEAIRKEARRNVLSSEVGKTILNLVKDLIIGEGINYDILSYDDQDPTNMKDDPEIVKMQQNWRAFSLHNKLDQVIDSWLDRLFRDGESLLRIFDAKADFAGMKVPEIRFIDGLLIVGQGEGLDLGVYHPLNDYYKILGYNQRIDGKNTRIKAEDVIHQKLEFGMEMLRGVSPFFPVLTNMRRFDKNSVNLSVLTAILSAIAFVRVHKNSTLPQVTRFLQKTADASRTVNGPNSREKSVNYMHAGTVIDSTAGQEYQFPTHQVSSDAFISVIELEARLIASPFNLPWQWLMSGKPDKAITQDDPTAKRYKKEQHTLFSHLTSLFWAVQKRMGIAEESQLKYHIRFTGPSIADGDDHFSRARAAEIEQRSGTLSPQSWARSQNRSYVIERKQTIKHRNTRQPGEVMPGDAGNTNVTQDSPTAGQGGNGASKK